MSSKKHKYPEGYKGYKPLNEWMDKYDTRLEKFTKKLKGQNKSTKEQK